MPIVIISGDMYQLPPVRASPLYSEMVDIDKKKEELKDLKGSHKLSATQIARRIRDCEITNEGLHILRTFFDKAILLNENVRQADDDLYASILSRVRSGTCTRQDRMVLVQRTLGTYNGLKADTVLSEPWKSCRHYFPSVEEVNEANEKVLLSLYPDASDRFDCSPFISNSGHHITHEDVEKRYGKKTAQKVPPLHLAVGARVMITYNVSPDWGVINGSFGTCVGYTSSNGSQVDHILVELDSPNPNMPPLTLRCNDNGGMYIRYIMLYSML
jgi:hypothetical protein